MAAEYTRKEAYMMLGLKEGCSFKEVSGRYRLLIKSLHPDSAGDGATEYAARLNMAYECIRQGSFLPERVVYKDRVVYRERTVYRDKPDDAPKKGEKKPDAGEGAADAAMDDEISVTPFRFAGRTGRGEFFAEFILGMAMYALICFILNRSALPNEVTTLTAAVYLWEVASACARRLRDAGYSPLCIFEVFIPLAGIFMLIGKLIAPTKE